MAGPPTDAGERLAVAVWRGDPALTLIQGAEENEADLVVVGSHGHSKIERFLMGSVAEPVLRHANCSVLIIKGPVQRERNAAGLTVVRAASGCEAGRE